MITVITATMTLAIGARSTRQVRREIGRLLMEMSSQLGSRMDRDLWSLGQATSLLSNIIAQERARGSVHIQSQVDTFRRLVPAFAWIGVTDASGRVLTGSDGLLVGQDLSKRPIFRGGLEGTYLGDLHAEPLLAGALPHAAGEPLQFLDLSRPIVENGRTTGVLVAHLSWSWATRVQKLAMARRRPGSETEVLILSSDGRVLLGPADVLGRRLHLQALAQAGGEPDGSTVERWPDGRDYLTGYSTCQGNPAIQALGWTVLARQPLSVAYAPARALQATILAWGVGMAVVFGILGWFIAHRISTPLRRIAEAADRLRNGAATEIPEHKGISDIESLSASLRAMIETLTRTEAARDHAEKQAILDRLTGLPNRLAVEAFLGPAVAAARRDGGGLAVLCMDLDGFKAVNDTYGHPAGDRLLQEVAHRLSAEIRSGDLVARLGGDEFLGIIRTQPGTAAQGSRTLAERVIESLGRPVDLGGAQAQVGCSVGIALWPGHGEDIQETLLLADRALYDAKRTGKNRAVLCGEGSRGDAPVLS